MPVLVWGLEVNDLDFSVYETKSLLSERSSSEGAAVMRFFLGVGCLVYGLVVVWTGRLVRGMTLVLGEERYLYGGVFIVFGIGLAYVAIRDFLRNQ